MTRKQLVYPVSLAAVLAAVVSTGCATKGYVNRRVDEVKVETAELRNSTQEALARARTASGTADEARDLALGRAGLEEVNRYSVFFRFDSDEIDDSERSTLDRAADEIASRPEVIVDVYGFADPTGPDRYNLSLGQRRAEEVVRYLAANSPTHLSRYAAVSYGERGLAGMEAESAENSRQRRVVVSLIRRIPLEPGEAPSAELVPGP
jgi:outer membrane protein OmpA-like peptidoglycan-associated protein